MSSRERDTLIGGVDKDALIGGGDNDFLDGGSGSGTCGVGEDTYIFDPGSDCIVEGATAAAAWTRRRSG